MPVDRWRELERLFQLALDRPPAERDAFVAACGADETLQSDVMRLLTCHEEAEGFLETPAIEQLPDAGAEESHDPGSIGPYRILGRLGCGGMGIVYLAERSDDQYRNTVAIKVVPSAFQDDLLRWRFRNERQILANLNHPNIARLFDGGTTADGVLYLVMEYVEGEPIDSYCESRNLPMADRLRLFRQVCSAMTYAHQNLVVHRDIKPSNILVTADGVPKLLDFGIAKLLSRDPATRPASITTAMLTPEYASPEQVRGEPITTASDVYSLGVLLYRLLVGESPYRLASASPHEIAQAVCSQEPERPSARAAIGARDIDSIVLMSLRKEPQQRYLSVAQLSSDIGRLLDGLPVIARKPTLAYYTGKFIGRHRIAFAAASVAMLLLITGMAATILESRRARREQARAEAEKNRAESTLKDVLALTHSLLFDYNDTLARLPGSTEVRGALLRDAARRLDQLAARESTNPALLRETAAAYLKIGDILGKPYAANLGDTEGALQNYRKAAAMLETLSPAPQDSGGRLALSDAYESIGDILTRKLEYDGALEIYRKSLSIRQRLAEADRGNPEYARLVARTWISIGDPLQYQQDLRGSQGSYGNALAILQTLAAQEPANAVTKRQLAKAYHRVAASFEATGDFLNFGMAYREETEAPYRAALEHYRAAAEIAAALLARDPNDTQHRRFSADLGADQARVLTRLGETDAALGLYAKLEEQFAAMSAQDPANAESRFDLINLYRSAAAAYEKGLRIGKAFENYSKALQMSEALRATDPKNYQLVSYLRSIYTSMTLLQERTGEIGAAIRSWRAVMSISQDLYARGLNSAMTDSFTLTRLLTKNGDVGEARKLASHSMGVLKAKAERWEATGAELSTYAQFLLTCRPEDLRDERAALEYARRGAKRDGKPAAVPLVSLALAYQTNHQENRAVEAWRQALALLPGSFAPGDTAHVRQAIDRSLKVVLGRSSDR